MTYSQIMKGWNQDLERAKRFRFNRTDVPSHAVKTFSGRAAFNTLCLKPVDSEYLRAELAEVPQWFFDGARGVWLGRHAKGVFVMTADAKVMVTFLPVESAANLTMARAA